MNVVFIVPTGIGAEIGGHSGDATPAAKLLAELCDTLFVHPNVVNASDINEMTENMFYVEGSILDGFLEGKHGLESVFSNKILLAANKLTPEIVNAASAARATMGADIELLEFDAPIIMTATVVEGVASGDIEGLEEAKRQVEQYRFDVLVVNTPIETDSADVIEYLSKDGGTNIWGGVEAKLSKAMSQRLGVPVIHAPVGDSPAFKSFNEEVDPRKAAEMVSVCYLHCCLKGGHLAPKMSQDLRRAYWNTDIDFLVSPINVFGRPHAACQRFGIPVIAVRENKTVLNDPMPADFIIAENYLEAAGIICAKQAGVTLSSVRRPLGKTKRVKP